MTNLEYSKTKSFVEACRKSNIVPTTRQASKFRRGVGAVYQIVIMGNDTIHVPKEAAFKQ